MALKEAPRYKHPSSYMCAHSSQRDTCKSCSTRYRLKRRPIRFEPAHVSSSSGGSVRSGPPPHATSAPDRRRSASPGASISCASARPIRDPECSQIVDKTYHVGHAPLPHPSLAYLLRSVSTEATKHVACALFAHAESELGEGSGAYRSITLRSWRFG